MATIIKNARRNNMKILISLSTDDLKKLVLDHIKSQILTTNDYDPKNVTIETKSKQNYKSEWEVAEFRAIYEVNEK